MYCNCIAVEATAAAGKGTDWTNKPFTRHYIGQMHAIPLNPNSEPEIQVL